MKIDFRVDWGYWMLYSRRHYHPIYKWDGYLECVGEHKLSLSLLTYPALWWGPCFSAEETPLEGLSFKSTTRRRIAGIRVRGIVADDAEFVLHTASGTFRFTLQQILEEGRISFPVGPKYGFCRVVVTRSGYLHFRPLPALGEVAYEAAACHCDVCNWQRMDLAIVRPGEAAVFKVRFPEELPSEKRSVQLLTHLQAMIRNPRLPNGKNHIAKEVLMHLEVNGIRHDFRHYYRWHDQEVQLLEDVWTRCDSVGGEMEIKLFNDDDTVELLLSRVKFSLEYRRHLELVLPHWVLCKAEATGTLWAVHAGHAVVKTPEGAIECEVQPGWNSFSFRLDNPGRRLIFSTEAGEAILEEAFLLTDEKPEVRVGYDLTVVPHDDFGCMEELLGDTARTQLGNLVVFRNFRPLPGTIPAPDSVLEKFGAFCRDYHIYVSSVNCHASGALQRATDRYFDNGGAHEYPGVVYAADPTEPYASHTMKEAAEKYVRYLKEEIDRTRAMGVARTAFGDAAGGPRYLFLAGVDVVRSETMVPHTNALCTLARAAAESLGTGEWGVHIAIQHCGQLYEPECHLKQYLLSLYMPWMMGANFLYDEDSLFQLFKEERQCFDDALTKGKRDITRDFFRFAKTHPRRGRAVRRIASLEGLYAAPFNGFICGGEQDPSYSVWGYFGNNAPEWGHNQCEKYRQVLDVLMPGASSHPLRQDFSRRRFFFSGNPYGDFDQVPVEAPQAYLNGYDLLVSFGWNTMEESNYAKLYAYVASGGTLLIGLPEFSTWTGRRFMREMEDLGLFRDGDLSELCGVRINGRSEKIFSGTWNGPERGQYPEVSLSAMPSVSITEDGPCWLADVELAGAEVVLWDADNGLPLVVRHSVGKGCVYLLTCYAYAGHEQLQGLSARLLAKLAKEIKLRDPWQVESSNQDLFYTLIREEEGGCGEIHLLNTDWTTERETIYAWIKTPAAKVLLPVYPAAMATLSVLPFALLHTEKGAYIERLKVTDDFAGIRLHSHTDSEVLHIYYGENGENTVRIDMRPNSYCDLTLRWQNGKIVVE